MVCKSGATKSDKDAARDVLERVTSAVEVLCVGKGDVRSRLQDALIYHLVPLREQDFPVCLQNKFREILQMATKYDASDLDRTHPLPYGRFHNQHEGQIQSTMRRIRRSTGTKIAGNVWHLYNELRQICE